MQTLNDKSPLFHPGADRPATGRLRCRVARSGLRALLLAAAVALPGLASAGVEGVISTTVKALSTEVTYASVSKSGAPLVTYLGYEFTTTYFGTNTTNNVVLQGDLIVSDQAELATLALDTESTSGACSAQTLPDRIRLTCSVGQVRSGAAPIVHMVFFKAPTKVDANGVADVTGSDLVTLSGTTYYAEVSDGAGNTNNTNQWSAADVELGTPSDTDVKSVLPKAGRLFTGNGGVASDTDPFGTDVTVPGHDSYTTAEIFEGVEADCTSGIFSTLDCYTLDLSIQDGDGVTVLFKDALTIRISIDGSIVPPRYKPQDLTIKYEDEVVGLCPAPGVALEGGKPCINSAVRIKDKKNPDRDGDIEIEFLNYKNGRFTIA